VVPALFDHDFAYLLQMPDKRVVFAIPYERDFTLIGTTEVEHHGALGALHIEADEIAYLCEQVSRYFQKPVVPADVVWRYAGVRPLLDDGSGDAASVTRDYALELDVAGAPVLSVWGGKLTTFRKLAEEAADRLAAPLQIKRGAWTAQAVLPGGDFSEFIGASVQPDTDFARFAVELARRHPELPAELVQRWARAYGSRAERVIDSDGLGAEVAPGLFEAELSYLHRCEWARSADDVLWRRSKLGLHFRPTEREAVARWCDAQWGAVGGAAAAAPGSA
jgi:glycerol-3-phosphate dehydrogenase